jgi:cytokinesis protein
MCRKGIKGATDIELEMEILKFFKKSLSNKNGAIDSMQKPQVIHGLCYSLTSPNLPARKAAAEILVFFCHWEEEGEERVGLGHVLQGLGHVETHHNANNGIGQKVGKFDIWLRQLETTVEGRGRMGSTVGMSKDLRGTDDSTILDICVSSASLVMADDRSQ